MNFPFSFYFANRYVVCFTPNLLYDDNSFFLQKILYDFQKSFDSWENSFVFHGEKPSCIDIFFHGVLFLFGITARNTAPGKQCFT